MPNCRRRQRRGSRFLGGEQLMNKGLAWAVLLCLTASGCAGTGLFSNRCGDEACHVVRSQRAPPPQIMRDACMQTCGGLFGGRNDDCCGDCCDASCGTCCDDCCGDCCDGGCCGDCCSNGGIFGGRANMRTRADRCDRSSRRLIGNIAGGFCGDCSTGCGLCRDGRLNPHGVGYPEPQRFNAGPPTGQVAYPYYTVRGPRDFLQNNPTRIGPY